MSFLDRFKTTPDITHENATYNGRRLACPDCGRPAEVLQVGERRTLSCWNCGYRGRIAKGVRVVRDTEDDEESPGISTAVTQPDK